MKIDHYALRVHDRKDASNYFRALGFKRTQEFMLFLPNGLAESIAMEGPDFDVFISDGPGLGQWLHDYGPGIHHIAYAVDSVEDTVLHWLTMGIKFQTEVLTCPCDEPMKQIFTTEKFGVCHELIERNGHPGFCLENVRRLMEGTQ
jgi:4-hydroxyphenylpyruvate dioxygenase-like putative hemolysin